MGFVLDTILKKELIKTPETVNTTYFSETIEIDNREDSFAVQIEYDNGINVDMTFHLLVSTDDDDYVRVTDTDQVITDSSGVHIYDVAGTGAPYLRVEIEVRTGSIDLTTIRYNGKRRH